MKENFSQLVDKVRELSLTEKIEIKSLLNKSISEEKRNRIYKNYLKAKREYKNNKLEFSNDVDKLKKLVQ